MLTRVRTAALLTLVLLATACAPGGKAEVEDDFSDLAQVDQKSDSFSYRLKLLGALRDGDVKRVLYRKTPRFRGFTFTAAAGDQVDVSVHSTNGDPVTWVLDGHFKVIAKNDDADPTTYDSHVVATLPASPVPTTYYVIFRDYDLESHWFEVDFQHTPSSWEQAARTLVLTMVADYSPLAPFAVDPAALPPAARARYEVIRTSGLELPLSYKLKAEGRDFYLVLATDGSGEGGTVVVDLVDAGNRWFAHGIGHAFWDDVPYFAWDLEDTDPTVCRCGVAGAGDFAVCSWTDGSTVTSPSILCDATGWENAARELVQDELRDGWDMDDPRRVDPATLPPAARSRLDVMLAAPDMEFVRSYRLTVRGGDLLLILGNADAYLWVDLVGPMDRWFAHGTGRFADGTLGLGWTLDDSDPTICSCAIRNPDTEMAGCQWTDSSVIYSLTLECD